MKMNDFEIEAMLSLRLYQRFFIFVISPDYDDNEIIFCSDA